MNSAVAINARIFTSIISLFFLLRNNSGFNPIEMINLSLVNSMQWLTFQWHRIGSIICQLLNELLLWNVQKKDYLVFFFFINLINICLFHSIFPSFLIILIGISVSTKKIKSMKWKNYKIVRLAFQLFQINWNQHK